MKLILFGGVQGVGKSTLLAWILKEYKGRVEFIDPGELFRQFCYHNKVKTAEEVEGLIVEKILAMPDDATVVVHWHYAVPRPNGYIPQIDFARLERLIKTGKVQEVVLVSLEAPVEVIVERRSRDASKKKRDLSPEAVAEEIQRDLEFVQKHVDLFATYLGVGMFSVHRIENIDLESAKTKVRGCLGFEN